MEGHQLMPVWITWYSQTSSRCQHS